MIKRREISSTLARSATIPSGLTKLDPLTKNILFGVQINHTMRHLIWYNLSGITFLKWDWCMFNYDGYSLLLFWMLKLLLWWINLFVSGTLLSFATKTRKHKIIFASKIVGSQCLQDDFLFQSCWRSHRWRRVLIKRYSKLGRKNSKTLHFYL